MSDSSAPLVVHIIYALGAGGLENGLVNLINRTPPGRYRHAIICLTAAQAFAQRITVPGVEIIELHKRDRQDWPMYWRLLKLLRQLRPAIIHTRNLAALDSQVLGLLVPGARQVHGEHGRDIYDLDGSNWKYRQLRRFMRLFVDHYIAVSRDLQQWLRESIGVRDDALTQIYNGVDWQKFTPRSGERPALLPAPLRPEQGDPLVIGTVGRLVAVKDQRSILLAVQALLRQRPAWRRRLRVVLVGGGPLEAELRQLAVDCGIDDLVWMTGDRDDIPELLRTMDVFLLPSLGEGISNTILEAMAAGLPVVATSVGGNPELVEDGVNGRLVPVGDAPALAEAVLGLLEDDRARRRMGDAALQGVRLRFDWDRAVSEYLGVYDGLLGAAGVSGEASVGAAPRRDLEVR
jgi:sugar transferase (PEP-CTERM/EpsH1 system associated)